MSSNNEAFFSDGSAHPADCLDVKTVQTGRFQTGGPSVMEKEHKLCIEKHQGGGIVRIVVLAMTPKKKKKKPCTMHVIHAGWRRGAVTCMAACAHVCVWGAAQLCNFLNIISYYSLASFHPSQRKTWNSLL